MEEHKVYIVVLNYNNSFDTIECLNSLLKLSYINKNIIVCDNGSGDGSFPNLVNWASQKSHSDKTLKYYVLNEDQGSSPILSSSVNNLFFIDNRSNLGYAAGNNVGLRYAMSMGDLSFGWILNNDTVVHEEALGHLVDKMIKNPEIGLCGSTLLYRHVPGKVQALGGFKYYSLLGISRQIGNGTNWNPERVGSEIEAIVEKQMFGVQGASVFVRKEFLEQIGLMPEDYFLYCEEADWAMKAKGKFLMGYASSSIVFHKEGPSTGSNSYSSTKSLFSEYFLTRNRLVFTQKYFPYFLTTVLFGNGLISLKRFLKGQYRNGFLVILCTLDFLTDLFKDQSRDPIGPSEKRHLFFKKPLSRFLLKGTSVK